MSMASCFNPCFEKLSVNHEQPTVQYSRQAARIRSSLPHPNSFAFILGSNLLLSQGTPLSRAETLGTVTSRELKPHKFLKFTVDDGTGCVPCVLWLNHLSSPYFSRRNPADVRLIADLAEYQASEVKLGVLVRVRGRITAYRGTVQITVSNVIVERDPNMEILHWLDCIKLARKCYDVMPHGK
ncbi:CST complex subunit STN1 [Vitis vinifera]|uniref:CST complex subunit STN1 n=1 Tax=Vitis vinifera TaxID=29760 RepID=A0A438KI10_VITVI|nr:CST complex subunit STN1 [Vitis vinifera]